MCRFAPAGHVDFGTGDAPNRPEGAIMATEHIPLESNPRQLLILMVAVEAAAVAFLSMALYFALR